MIHEFKGRSRILYFPKQWANSVASWLLGVKSSDGTIEIKNTANPDKEGSIDLKVNEAAVLAKVEKHVAGRALTNSEVRRVRDIVHGALDGLSVVWNNGHVSVSMDWLLDVIKKNMMTDGENGAVTAPATTTSIDSGFSGVIANYATKKTDTKTFGKATDAGAKIMLCCRGADGGENGAVFWREFTIAGDGRIYQIAGESEAMGMYTDQ